jgi:hypothetical protein
VELSFFELRFSSSISPEERNSLASPIQPFAKHSKTFYIQFLKESHYSPPEKPIRPLSLKGGFALSIRALTLIKTKYFVLIKVKGGAETQVGALGLQSPNEARPDEERRTEHNISGRSSNPVVSFKPIEKD